jgi:hypothetical protein
MYTPPSQQLYSTSQLCAALKALCWDDKPISNEFEERTGMNDTGTETRHTLAWDTTCFGRCMTDAEIEPLIHTISFRSEDANLDLQLLEY